MTFALGVTLAALITTFTLVWVASITLRDVSIVDIWWGVGFVITAWLYCVQLNAFEPRPLMVAALITVWGARLASHIYRRHRGQPEDRRYAAIRRNHGQAFWWRSLFIVFWLQAALVWFIALPIFVVAYGRGPSDFTVNDIAGLICFAIGFAFEAIGDAQLERFKAYPANRGRVLETGLWRYTRHPNYFGDALLWWGVYLIATSVPGGWLTIWSPVTLTVLLLRVSGVTLLERGLIISKPDYAAYVARTSAFVPWRPRPQR
jgi:steroid 5-alpha reductase family enzyme